MTDKYLKFIILTILVTFALLIVTFGIYFNIKLIVAILVDVLDSTVKKILILYVLIPALFFWIRGVILFILYYYKENKDIFIKNKTG